MKKALLVVLLLLIGAGIWLYPRLWPRRVGGTPMVQLPLAVQRQRRVEAGRLEDQISNVVRSTRNHDHRRFTLTASENQLNTLMQDRLKMTNLPLRSPRVGLQDGVLAMQGDITYRGFDTTATLEGKVRAKNGKLAFDLQSLQIAGFDAPAKWRRKLEQGIEPKLNSLLKNVPGRIDTVTIQDGFLTLEGVTD